jgi:hypothetical protein
VPGGLVKADAITPSRLRRARIQIRQCNVEEIDDIRGFLQDTTPRNLERVDLLGGCCHGSCRMFSQLIDTEERGDRSMRNLITALVTAAIILGKRNTT